MDAPLAAYNSRNAVSKVEGITEPPGHTAAYDCSGYCSGPPLFTQIVKDPGQISFIPFIHQFRRREAFPGIHPHVEVPPGSQRKPPISRIKLVGRHSQIEQNPVHSVRGELSSSGKKVREILLLQHGRLAILAQAVSGVGEGFRVTVKAYQPSTPLQDRSRMPGSSQGRINNRHPCSRSKVMNHLFHQDWNMVEGTRAFTALRLPFSPRRMERDPQPRHRQQSC
jgi:hypothetical protein